MRPISECLNPSTSCNTITDRCRSPNVASAPVEPPPELIGFPRVAKRRRDRVRQRIGVAHLLAARDVERGIGHDPVQPRAERLIRQEPVERPKRVQEPFLNRILGILVREHDRPRHRVRPPLVKTHERGKRFRIALLRGDDKRLLLRPLGESLIGLRRTSGGGASVAVVIGTKTAVTFVSA